MIIIALKTKLLVFRDRVCYCRLGYWMVITGLILKPQTLKPHPVFIKCFLKMMR